MLCGAPGSGTAAPSAFAMWAPTIFPLTDAVTGEQLQCRGISQRFQRHRTHEGVPARRCQPVRDRRLAACEHQADVRAKGREKRLAQPRVEEAKDFVGVEDQHDAVAQAPNPLRDRSQRRCPGADGRCQTVNEAAVRRLDGPAVQQHDGRAC